MSKDFFQIDKKEILSKFKRLANKHAEREDDYNPSHSRTTSHPSGYFILDRIRALYHWVIEEIKIDLRRKYIHDDKQYKKVFGELENYARNKIRSESDGTMYLRVNNKLTFRGDKKQYRDELVQSRNKQVSVVKKIIDELNAFLRDQEPEDENKPVLNDATLKSIYKEHTADEIADIILQEVPEDYLLEMAAQSFINFNNKMYILMNKYNITAADTKEILNKIQESFTPQESKNESETDNTESEAE
tara:strand:+ start:320 stop:1057 length:738 start_codon:yes stop_codon:yes gene_type:complete